MNNTIIRAMSQSVEGVTLLEAFKSSYLLSDDKEFGEYLKSKANKIYKNKKMASSALWRCHKSWLRKNFKLELCERGGTSLVKR